MPIDYREYPENWSTEIRPRILARAGEVRNEKGEIEEDANCEWCGVVNHSYIVRYEAFPGYTHFRYCLPFTPGAVKVVLTVAHLDHDIHHNEDENLAALCQACHLRHDAGQHAENARKTRERKTGQLNLFEEVI